MPLPSSHDLPVILDSRSSVLVTLTPREGYPAPPALTVATCYVRPEDLATCAPLLSGDVVEELLADAGREVDAAVGRRYGGASQG
jgi:hypothetical protein